ncbi:uncharacterized protein ARMOST_09081 [Armillaria ostoyae]|uniref:Uncharacterized protein n=1 Tax=Armillaria ostoyae TaxID=47428 RepID=A0A284RAE9_ARMOS|nr:uncharacterized protein ARMOST_09081 [Armillaria ostoyae]
MGKDPALIASVLLVPMSNSVETALIFDASSVFCDDFAGSTYECQARDLSTARPLDRARATLSKIVDACPSTHPANYCKIAAFGGSVPEDEACEASGVNAFDIAITAKSILSSFQGNLNIDIETTSC